MLIKKLICPQAVLVCVLISCCCLLIIGKSYIAAPPCYCLFPSFLIIQYTMILAVMSPVNRPVIGTAIPTECVCVIDIRYTYIN